MPASRSRSVGPYALCDEIARDDITSVYLARFLGPVGFARTLAVQRPHDHFAQDPEFSERFLEEARLTARIRHPNVVPVLDVVTHYGELLLVMDYVAGGSLARLVAAAAQNGERVPPRIACAIVSGVLHGLHAAHEAKSEKGQPLQLVHRGLSPRNVLVGADGVARVIDFGVVRAALSSRYARAGHLDHTLRYLAPEEFEASGRVDCRADVFAAGILLWETLSGRNLFQGNDADTILLELTHRRIPLPSSFDPRLTDRLDQVVVRALAREPGGRYQTAREFAIALEHAYPIATPREVGEWVESQLGASLTRRRHLVREIERASAAPAPSREDASAVTHPRPLQPDSELTPSVPPSGGWQISTSGRAENPRARTRTRNALVSVAAMLATLLAGSLFLLYEQTVAMTSAAPAAAALPATEAQSSRRTAKPDEPSSDGVPIVSVSDLAIAEDDSEPVVSAAQPGNVTARAADSANSAAATPQPARETEAAVSAESEHPQPAPSCSPPYRVDSRGIRHPKPHCL